MGEWDEALAVAVFGRDRNREKGSDVSSWAMDEKVISRNDLIWSPPILKPFFGALEPNESTAESGRRRHPR